MVMIELTKDNGKTFLINTSHIIAISQLDDNKVCLSCRDNIYITVAPYTYEDIKNTLEQRGNAIILRAKK